jgi:predicted nicotinamide N-methyase
MMPAEPNASLKTLGSRFDLVSTELTIAARGTRVWHPRSAEDLIDEEAFDRDERLPYWADIWPSSLVLADRVGKLDGSKRTLLELGCGVGVVAIAAARAGFAVTATDYYDEALEFTALNVRENVAAQATTCLVDWRSIPSSLGAFDVVVASDVLYERPYAGLIAMAFCRTLLPSGVGYLTDPGRIATPAFIDAARQRGLSIDVVEKVPYESGAIRQRIDVYEIRR